MLHLSKSKEMVTFVSQAPNTGHHQFSGQNRFLFTNFRLSTPKLTGRQFVVSCQDRKMYEWAARIH